jgi:hypothetical protein
MLAQVCANPIDDQAAQFFLALCCSRPAAGIRVLENAGYSLEMVCRAVLRDRHQEADEWLHWHPEVW